jgi:hypothetical protein
MKPPRPSLKVLLLYVGVTAIFGYPLLSRMGSAVPNDLGDPLLNTWILWWNSRAMPLTADWWNAPAFFPTHDVLALSEHLVGLSPLTTPLIWLSGSPLLAYNVAFLSTFMLSARGAYLLVQTVTRRHDVAFVAGLAYAFSPYRMSQLAQIQVLASFWMPVALAALHRYVADRRPRWLVLFAVATVLQSLTNGYYLFFFPVLVLLWLMWFSPPRRLLATVGAVGGSLAAGDVLLLPFLLHYREVHERFRLERLPAEIARFSAGVDDLLRTSPDLILWGPWLGASGPGPRLLFPGFVCGVLILGAAVLGRRKAGEEDPGRGVLPRRIHLALVVVASGLSLVALGRLAFGPWRLDLLGLTISTGELAKPVTEAAFLWAIVALTGPSARRRSPFAFYAIGAVVMWVLSFGPVPLIGDVELLRWTPYRWLEAIPGFGGLRVPARFAMLAVLCLSTAAGLALARLQARVGRRVGALLVVLASVGILAEGWRHVRLLEPPRSSMLRATDPPGAVLELPLQSPVREVPAVFRGIQHLHPVVNGYSGYEPASAIILRWTLPLREQELLQELAAQGVRYLVVFKDRDRKGQWRRYIRAYPGAKRVRGADGQVLFSLPGPLARAATGCEGPPLPVARLQASLLPDRAARALDLDVDTWWETGRPQRPGDEIVVTLDAPGMVRGVELSLGPRYAGFPRELSIESSSDRRDWSVLWQGSMSGRAFAAAVRDPGRMPLQVCFPATRARYLRLRQVGSAADASWVVAELVILGTSSPGASGTRAGEPEDQPER